MEMKQTLYDQQVTLKCEMFLSITFTVWFVRLGDFTYACFYVVIL